MCELYGQSPEVCDNGLDDDFDGKIDLNDSDCLCKGIKDTLFVPSSLIPNPSFEDHSCCPTGLAQMYCSNGWIQASDATSDYFHTCGLKDDPMRGSPPQPLPAGNGYVGFLDLRAHPARQNASYKEYIGSCLTKPMTAGKEYTLSFWIGFGNPGNSYGPRAITTLGVYGTTACANLPFGTNNSWNCPTSYTGWSLLSSVTASGSRKWVKVQVKIKPTQNIEAIAIGPECNRADGLYYYFLDELILEESFKFDSIILQIAGDPCKDSIRLSSPASVATKIKYQWFKDGIAIPGAINPNFVVPKADEGRYVLRAQDGNDCELSNEYVYDRDTTVGTLNVEICREDSLMLHNMVFHDAGTYHIMLQNSKGCDSLLELALSVYSPSVKTIDTTLCEGSSLLYNQLTYDSTGSYSWHSPTQKGCDSITNLNLKIIPIARNQVDTMLCQGQSLVWNGQVYSQSGTYIQTGISSLGCDSIQTIHLDLVSNIKTNIDTTICEGSNLQIDGLTLDTAGLYSFDYKSAFGCDSTLILDLKLSPIYTIRIDTSQCEGSSLLFGGVTYVKSGVYTLNLVSSKGCDSTINLHLNFRPNSSFNIDTTICFNQVLNVGAFSYGVSGDYEQKYVSTNACDSIVKIKLKITDRPVLKFNTEEPRCYQNRNGSIVCTIDGKSGPYTWIWEDGSTQLQRSGLPAGIYHIKVRDQIGCLSESEVELREPNPLLLKASTVNPNCFSPDSGKLGIDLLSGGTAPYSIILDGQSAVFVNNLKYVGPGTHNLEVTDSKGCLVRYTFNILDPSNSAVAFSTDTIEVTLGDSVLLEAKLINVDSLSEINWTGSGVVRCNTCPASFVIPDKSGGLFTITVKDQFGCEYTASVFIKVKQHFYVPNVFSPNGDNINDYFNLISDSSVERIDVLNIFDRWGDLLYEYHDFAPNGFQGAWDGNVNGQKALPGVYIYLFQFKDKAGDLHHLSGDLSLIR